MSAPIAFILGLNFGIILSVIVFLIFNPSDDIISNGLEKDLY